MRSDTGECLTTRAWPVRCEELTVNAAFPLRPHTHDQPHACFVLEGSLREYDGSQLRTMSRATGRLSPGGDEHRMSVGPDGVRCIVLSVDDEFVVSSGVGLPDERRYLQGDGFAGIGRRLAAELNHSDDVSPVCLELLALETTVLADGSRPSPSGSAPGWLVRVCERVRDDLRSVPSLAELAADAGVSRAHLARVFRARYGCTIGQYVRRQRIEVARRLLLGTDLPLASIAFQAGFSDQSHMTRTIGTRFGRPPGRLRSSLPSA